MKKRLLSALLVLLLAAAAIVVACLKIPFKSVEGDDGEAVDVVYDKETVYLWYSDDALTDYLNAACVQYNEEHGTRIVPSLQSPLEYLNNINKTSIEADVPDLYIVSHDMLGTAYMAGLASEISMDKAQFESLYLKESEAAVTYKDMLMGYPLSFETSTMLYNETYLKSMALKALWQDEMAAESDGEEEEADPRKEPEAEPTLEELEAKYTPDQIAAKIQEILPVTMEQMTELADNFDAPDEMESFMTWDVSDIFYNYFFIGDAIDVGGEEGWDKNKIDIYNLESLKSFKAYQGLNNFFSIDPSESKYGKILNDFIEGKIVFTIATTDAIGMLEAAKAEGTLKYDYGVMLIPDMNESLDTRAMSTTACVAINPYSKHVEVANDFAKHLTVDYSQDLYMKTGKITCSMQTEYDFPAFTIFALEYNYSKPLPKILETNNFWVKLEATFAEVWEGGDYNKLLKELAEQMAYQVTGERPSFETIEVPDESEELEYFDEDAIRQELASEEDNG
ncbi:MAG: sugar ABC transporter substrate-binding protein [Lachnospiraceae bacterium]|nr:sugar ABC transporter substrate-binding protein [Lachnospiraceae bacterium]